MFRIIVSLLKDSFVFTLHHTNRRSSGHRGGRHRQHGQHGQPQHRLRASTDWIHAYGLTATGAYPPPRCSTASSSLPIQCVRSFKKDKATQTDQPPSVEPDPKVRYVGTRACQSITRAISHVPLFTPIQAGNDPAFGAEEQLADHGLHRGGHLLRRVGRDRRVRARAEQAHPGRATAPGSFF